jgi:hypothetical protein
MSDQVKTSGVTGTTLFREVDPVAPYPRITPHQPKSGEYPASQGKHEKGQGKNPRRFSSMRELVEELKRSDRIARVDYSTAEIEMYNQGLAIAEEQLISQLLLLKVPLTSIDNLFQQVRQQSAQINLAPGRKLTDDSFPQFPSGLNGLSEYCLVFPNLQLRLDRQNSAILEEINNNGRYFRDIDQLRLTFRRPLPTAETPQEGQLQLDIQVLVGAIEIDESGRRAILYSRGKHSFGLYSDKLINLSI